jgi:hypothetical protein
MPAPVMRPGIALEYRQRGFPRGLLTGHSAGLIVTMVDAASAAKRRGWLGRELVLTRYTEPEPELSLLLNELKLELPGQPPLPPLQQTQILRCPQSARIGKVRLATSDPTPKRNSITPARTTPYPLSDTCSR